MTFSKSDLSALLASSLSAKSETQNVEFKDGRGGKVPKDLWKAISAFSHDPSGGVIFFGVSEEVPGQFKITGGLEIADFQQKVSNYFSDVMVNVAPPEIHVLTYEGADILAVIVKPLSDERKPCFNKEFGLPNGACIRVGNSNRAISFEEMSQFIRNSAPFRFDRSKVDGRILGDLSMSKLVEFFENSAHKIGRAASNLTEQSLINAGIIISDGRGLAPTVGGFLIFSENEPQKLPEFARLTIRCIRYRGANVGTPIVDKRDIVGTLDYQIEEAQAFILRNIPLQAKIVGTKRQEEYAYPEDALREIVANAVIHRDYQITETYTQISVFSDHLEVSNPGNLPPGITIQNLKSSQFSRNEVISQILRDMNYMEEYGRGIDLIYSRMRAKGLLDPVFRNVSNSFKVTLLGPRFTELNVRQVEAWELLQQPGNNRITVAQYGERFGISRPSANNDLAELVELGLFKRSGAGPNTFYELEI